LEKFTLEAKHLQSNISSLNNVVHMHYIAVQTASPSQELPASIVMSCAIAESNHCHQIHREGTKNILIDYLDAEIQKQEDILKNLRVARFALNY
jgi:hypothetical protein